MNFPASVMRGRSLLAWLRGANELHSSAEYKLGGQDMDHRFLRGMRSVIVSVMLIAVVCLCPRWGFAQLSELPPEWQILFDARPNIERAEGRVFSVGGVVNTPPLLPEQTGAASARWHDPVRGDVLPEIRVSVFVYAMATAEGASRFFDGRPFTGGWTVEQYPLGDQATLTTGSGSMRYGIQFQEGRFIVFVSGDSREEVERIARHVLRAIPAAQPAAAPDGGQGFD